MLRPALALTLWGTALTGLAYPLALVAWGAALPSLAPLGGGPLPQAQGQNVGLAVVGQPFAHPAHLWGRPSATAGRPYESALAGATNLGPANPALRDAAATQAFALRAADRQLGVAPGAWLRLLKPQEAWPQAPQPGAGLAEPAATAAWPPEPVDLLTASGSGLDPHVSPAGALRQAPRIAKARGLSPEAVAEALRGLIEPPFLGLFGAARVSVLRANLLLDARFGPPKEPLRQGG